MTMHLSHLPNWYVASAVWMQARRIPDVCSMPFPTHVISLVNIPHLNVACGAWLGGFRIRRMARRCGLGDSVATLSVA